MPRPSADGALLPRAGSASGARAVLELARWPNALIASAGVLLGAWWSGAVSAGTWLAALSALGLTAFANAVNDIHDVAIDRVAHPRRPLPRAALSPSGARSVAGASAALAIAAAALVDPALCALSVAVAAAMMWYSARLKRRGLPGNALVALLASMPFLYGAWSVGPPARGLALVALAAPLHFARELAKDLDDAAADAVSRRTLPLTAGARAARLSARAATLLFAALALAFFAGRSVPAAALAAAAVATALVGAWRAGDADARAPRTLKGAMLLAMTALAVECALRAA